MGDVELQSIACPVKGLSLASDLDTDLSNDVQSPQIVCKKELYNTEPELLGFTCGHIL